LSAQRGVYVRFVIDRHVLGGVVDKEAGNRFV
jgi:hypothetical protein